MEPQGTRQLRLSSTVRGFIIAALVGCHGFITDQPNPSLAYTLLIAAGLQVVVLLLRHFVPAGFLPQVMHLFELLVDAATVLLFALGVFGGIVRFGLDA